MANAKWKFLLANTNDLSSIGELTQARGRQLNLRLNAPGDASFSLPMSNDLAGSVSPLSTAIKAYRAGSTGTKLIWSGYVNAVEEQGDGMMTVSCVGWLQRLFLRLLRQNKTYPFVASTSTDDSVIVADLLAEANLTTAPDGYVVPIITGASPATPTLITWGGTLPNEGAGGATAYTNQFLGKQYQKWQNIGQSIQELTELMNGCDIFVTPDTRNFYVYRKRQVIRPEVVWGYNWGPNNVQSFGRQLDATSVVNYVNAQGRYGQGASDDPTSKNAYGLIEEQIALSDVVDPPTGPSVLATYAAGEVVLRSQPRVIYTLQPFPYTIGGRVPEPFVDYGMGDRTYITAIKKPRINVANQGARIFAMSVGIDEEGNERLGPLQLNNS